MKEYHYLDTPCCYNMGVLCEETGRQCDKCGWNPKVAKMRADIFRKPLKIVKHGWTWVWKEL